MKSFVTLFLFSLLLLSFVGEKALLSLNKKAKIEVSDDTDVKEKELKEKKSKTEYIALESSETSNPISSMVKPSVRYSCNLLCTTYEVDIRPPRV